MGVTSTRDSASNNNNEQPIQLSLDSVVEITSVESVPASDKVNSEELFEKEKAMYESKHKSTPKSTKKKESQKQGEVTTKSDRNMLHTLSDQVATMSVTMHAMAKTIEEIKRQLQSNHNEIIEITKHHANDLITVVLRMRKDKP